MKDNKIKELFIRKKWTNRSWALIVTVLSLIYVIVTMAVKIPTRIMETKSEVFSNLICKNLIINDFIKCLKGAFNFIILGFLADLLRKIGISKSFSKIDIINNKDIYRDIIYKYSIIALAYIDDFKEDFFKYISITLMSLHLKKKITMNNDEIIVIDMNMDGLKESEKYILRNIKEGKVFIKDSKEIQDLAKKEGIEEGLIKDNSKKSTWEINRRFFIIIGVIFFGSMIGSSYLTESNVEWLGTIILIVSFFATIILTLIIMIRGIINGVNDEIPNRTMLGEDMNTKLEGLKNYIKNYSTLNEKEKEQLELWDEYLIYSVMFGQNKKIVEDIKKLIILS